MSTSEKHYYKILVPEDGNISPQINLESSRSWKITVMPGSGSVIKEFNTAYQNIVSGVESRDIGLPAGINYISVGNYTSTADAPYQFEVKYEASDYFEKEFNNTLQTATPIESNQDYSGVLQTVSDDDYYTFTLPADGNVTVNMDRQVDSSWQLTTMNREGQTFKKFNTDYRNIVSGREAKDIGLPAGIYYLKVSNYTGTTDIPYRVTVDYEISDFYEKEFNDSLNTADQIEVNQEYTGFIQSNSDYDYYSFTLTEAGKVTLNMSREEVNSWRVILMDEKTNEYKNFTTEYRNIVIGKEKKEIGLGPGTYYIRVSHYITATDIPYKLEVEFERNEYMEKEFNDAPVTANPIELNKTYSGTVQNNSDKDFYRFNLQKDSTVSIKINRKSGVGWRVAVLDGNGKSYKGFVTEYSNIVDGPTTVDVDLAKGDYFVMIEHYFSTVDIPYFFSVESGGSPVDDGFEQWKPQVNVPANKEWTITFSGPINKSTIKKVYITDDRDVIVSILYFTGQANQLTLSPVNSYTSGKTYTLLIQDIESKSGKPLKENVKMLFTIK